MTSRIEWLASYIINGKKLIKGIVSPSDRGGYMAHLNLKWRPTNSFAYEYMTLTVTVHIYTFAERILDTSKICSRYKIGCKLRINYMKMNFFCKSYKLTFFVSRQS